MPIQNHHSVPRFLLRNFTLDRKGLIHVYDKSNNRKSHKSIRKIASEPAFYEVPVEDGSISIEPILEKIESVTAPILRKIIEARSLQVLERVDYQWLAIFVSVQFMRTKERRLTNEFLTEAARDKMKRMGATDEQLEELGILGTEEERKLSDIYVTLRSAWDFVPRFLEKGWMLRETRTENPLYISDNPVVLHNERSFGPYGNLGLAVPGIQIYLPISTTLCLELVCPSIHAEIREAWESLQSPDKEGSDFVDKLKKHSRDTRVFLEAYIKGNAINLDEEEVVRLNSLQVIHSSRFVFCEIENFDLVVRMIADDENFRTGHKPTID